MGSLRASRFFSIIFAAILSASTATGEPNEFGIDDPVLTDSSPTPTQFDAFRSEGLLQGAESLAESAPAPKVGMLGDTTRIRFEGAAAFDENDLRSALATDMLYQAAARPTGDLPGLLSILEIAITNGYRHCGFRLATASGRYSAATDEVIVRVNEGMGLQADGIRIEGASPEITRELAAQLGQPALQRTWVYLVAGQALNEAPQSDDDDDDAEFPWKRGEPAPCDQPTLDAISNRIAVELADMGYPFARFTVGTSPAESSPTCNLVIEIEDAGKQAVADDVEIDGLTRHSADEVREFLRIERGMPLTGDELKRICTALRESCRFWRSAVEIHLSEPGSDRYGGSARQAKLHIAVEEYELTPKLDEPLSSVDQCLVRTASWLQNFWNNGGDEELKFVVGLGEPSDLRTSGGALRMIISRQRGCLIQAKGLLGGVAVDAASILTGDSMALLDWRSGQKLSTQRMHTPRLDFHVVPEEKLASDEYKCTIKLGFGVNSTKPSEPNAPRIWTATIDPVAVVHTAHRKGATTSLKDGVVTIKCTGSTFLIDEASGRILSWEYHDSASHWLLKAVDGEFDAKLADTTEHGAPLRETFNPAAPLTSMTGFAASSLLAQSWIQEEPLARLGCEQVAALSHRAAEDPDALRAFYHQIFPAAKHADNAHLKFQIPQAQLQMGDNQWAEGLIPFAPALADVMFPRGSWPWTWVRELGFDIARREAKPGTSGSALDGGFEREMNRVLPEASLLGQLAMIAWSPRPLSDENIPLITRLALQIPEKDFASEVKSIVHGEHGFAHLCRGAICLLEELDEPSQKALLAELNNPWRDVVAQLIERGSTHPDEAREDGLEAVIVSVWNSGGRAEVQHKLHAMAGVPEPAEYPRTAAPAFHFTK